MFPMNSPKWGIPELKQRRISFIHEAFLAAVKELNGILNLFLHQDHTYLVRLIENQKRPIIPEPSFQMQAFVRERRHKKIHLQIGIDSSTQFQPE
jgi:hypothetical protein